MASTRREHDSLGEIEVPGDAMYGAQTQRAVENFPISGRGIPTSVIHALGHIKSAAARANAASSAVVAVDDETATAIAEAADEVAAGRWDDEFPVDVYQTGSGTSSNMNANEVIATRASQILGRPVHPNDQVNASQSSNDVFPTAVRLAIAGSIQTELLGALDLLADELSGAAGRFADVVKAGRTHLMDAAPLFLGQEFGAYAAQMRGARSRVAGSVDALCAVPLGGSAVGTGLNVPPGWAAAVRDDLVVRMALPVREPLDPFAAQAGADAFGDASGAMRSVAVALSKIANDLRLLASGPITGLGEIVLPTLQPGSSIMPGKVNPVLCEATVQVCARVMGNDVTVGIAAAAGQLELNTGLPLFAHVLDESVRLLASVSRLLAERCVRGIEADVGRARRYAESSPAVITGLAVEIGYEAAAHIVQRAVAQGTTVRDVLLADGMDVARIDRVLDVDRLARGGVADRAP